MQVQRNSCHWSLILVTIKSLWFPTEKRFPFNFREKKGWNWCCKFLTFLYSFLVTVKSHRFSPKKRFPFNFRQIIGRYYVLQISVIPWLILVTVLSLWFSQKDGVHLHFLKWWWKNLQNVARKWILYPTSSLDNKWTWINWEGGRGHSILYYTIASILQVGIDTFPPPWISLLWGWTTHSCGHKFGWDSNFLQSGCWRRYEVDLAMDVFQKFHLSIASTDYLTIGCLIPRKHPP